MAEDFPYRFEVTTTPAELQDRFANLAPVRDPGTSPRSLGASCCGVRWES